VLFHARSGAFCISAIDHLNKGVAFVNVDNAGLDHTIGAEQAPQMSLGRGDTSNEERPTENFDVASRKCSIKLHGLRAWWRKLEIACG
jgi:hypothetical protein